MMSKLLLALLPLFFLSADHDFHISKTTIRFIAEREQVQIEMHVFLDDLELALSEAGAPKLYIGTEDEMPQTAEVIARYLEKHFELSWNGGPIPVGMLGFELSDDLQALWIYLQAKTTASPQSIAVRNTVITEIYEDQRNLVKLVGGDKETTLLLSRDRPSAQHNF